MGGQQRLPGRADRTYVEDVKDPIEVQLPGSNNFFVALCVQESRERISSTLLDDLSLNLGHSPAIDSPSQLMDRLEQRLTELI